MRLAVLDGGQSLRARAAMRLAATAGSEMDDVAKTVLYRPELFGRAFIALLRDVLRGPSPWTVAERELMGAFVSRQNRCSYCVAVHSHIAIGFGMDLRPEALDHWHDAGFDPAMTAMLDLLERVVNSPDELGPADVALVRTAGVTDEAIADGLAVAFVFCLINRVASALGFSWASEADALNGARILMRMGYRLPGFLLR